MMNQSNFQLKRIQEPERSVLSTLLVQAVLLHKDNHNKMISTKVAVEVSAVVAVEAVAVSTMVVAVEVSAVVAVEAITMEVAVEAITMVVAVEAIAKEAVAVITAIFLGTTIIVVK